MTSPASNMMMNVAEKSQKSAPETNDIVLHPLSSKWTLWAHLPKEPDWLNILSYIKIMSIDSVESTIALTKQLPENMITHCMLFLMRDGIDPRWEDPSNITGGCFAYRVGNKHVPQVWRDLTYCLVGNTISANIPFVRNVNGITVSPKREFCIFKIWTKTREVQNPAIVTTAIKNLVPQGCLYKKHGE